MDTNIIMFGGLIMSMLSAVICYVIADRNGMSKVGWPILGFVLGLIGLLITFLVAFAKTPDRS